MIDGPTNVIYSNDTAWGIKVGNYPKGRIIHGSPTSNGKSRQTQASREGLHVCGDKQENWVVDPEGMTLPSVTAWFARLEAG